MLEILFKNFLSFDFIIFIMALVNAVILVQTFRLARKLYDALNPYCWIPGGEASLREIQGKFSRRNRIDSESDIVRLRRAMNGFYVAFENITAIFPLLGLLGTVVSLIPLVNNMGDVPTGLFFSALTSTMWGIIFAIAYKFANAFIASRIEDNEKNMDIYLQRNTDKVLKERALAESAGVLQKADEILGTEAAEEALAAKAEAEAKADSAAEAVEEVKAEVKATAESAVQTVEEVKAEVETKADNAFEEIEPVIKREKPDPAALAPEFFSTPESNKENADEKA